MAGDDPYTLSNGTLSNKLGITDARALARAETALVEARTLEIDRLGPKGAYDFERLKATHAYLFGAVYPWAGEVRTIGILKADFESAGRETAFTRPSRIPVVADVVFGRLAADGELKGLTKDVFVDKLTTYFSHVNLLHPFREGNGRTQEQFFSALARDAGHPLDLRWVTQERMVQVSIDAARGELGPMRQMFAEAADPQQVAKVRGFIEAIRDKVPEWNHRYIAMAAPGREYAGKFGGLSSTGDTFFMVTNREIYIGWARDLSGVVKSGDPVTFRAGPPPAAAAGAEAPGLDIGRSPGRPGGGLER